MFIGLAERWWTVLARDMKSPSALHITERNVNRESDEMAMKDIIDVLCGLCVFV